MKFFSRAKFSIAELTGVICLAFMLVPDTASARMDKQYGQTIYLPQNDSVQLKTSAVTLKEWLDKATGAEFIISAQKPSRGIVLALESTPGLPVDISSLKEQQSPESFLIYSDGSNWLWIIGKTAPGVDRGVFRYLDMLGCRWLHASDKWTIIPHREDITVKLDEVQSPAFLTRDFFGTGGFGRPACDPDRQSAEMWDKYKRENLLGGAFRLGGHTGEYINLTYKKELEAHPEYIAEVNGKRQFSATSKLCISNPGLQELFVKDRLNTLKRQIAADPETIAVSVEPADGGGHCSCANCLKLGSVSDRVFSLANITARAVAKEFPGKYVCLLAYNEHAGVPSIPLEPNIIVKLAPYAFQRTGLTPREMIEAWGGKHPFLGIYVYWCIPDWAHCLPALSTSLIADEIRFWHAHNVKVFSAESTYCGGNMGPDWYLASRLLWNPALDKNTVLDDYYTNAFGQAKDPVRRMYDRWDNGFMLTGHELGLCYRDLNEAMSLAQDPAVRARLADLGRYIHYLRLWHEFKSAPKGDAQVAAAKAVLNYLWRIYDSNMIQSFRLAQLLARDLKPALDSMDPRSEMWKNIPQLTDGEISALLADGTAKYQPGDYEERRYSDTLTPLRQTAAGAGGFVTSNTFSVSSKFVFTVKSPGRITLKIKVNKVAGRFDHVIVTGPKGMQIIDQRISANGEWTDLNIPATETGNYQMSVTDQKTAFTLQVPADLPFVCNGPYICSNLSGRTYFYVPHGLRRIAIYLPKSPSFRIFDPAGKPVNVKSNANGSSMLLIDVPAGMDGKIWSFDRFKSSAALRMLNTPSVFAFSEDGMMVPEEVKP